MFYHGGGKSNPLFDYSDQLAQIIYEKTIHFPKHELYGITSQIRRASISIILNLIEGFARVSPNEYRRFQSIAYGSLKETMYLVEFSKKQNYLSQKDYEEINNIAQRVSKILWTILYKKKSTARFVSR